MAKGVDIPEEAMLSTLKRLVVEGNEAIFSRSEAYEY
jgi:hypothetical protein